MNSIPQPNSYGNCNTNKAQSVVYLPQHFACLLEAEWNPSASAQIDRWLDYCNREGLSTVRGVAR